MNDERRYDEDEVRRIFDTATEAEATGRALVPARDGLTLAEVQEIGSEVGIPPELISRAAEALEVPATGGWTRTTGSGLPAEAGAAYRRVFGFPLGVEREVHLPRSLTDDEWSRLVMDVRRLFSARGHVESVGPLREWRNGNLYVTVGPTHEGAVLSMGTRKGDARPLAALSAFLLTFATVLLVVMVLTGEIAAAGAIVTPAILGSVGLGLLGANALRLPPWARTRALQMEEVAARALQLTSRAGPEEPGVAGP
jgi:hypothetical protein